MAALVNPTYTELTEQAGETTLTIPAITMDGMKSQMSLVNSPFPGGKKY